MLQSNYFFKMSKIIAKSSNRKKNPRMNQNFLKQKTRPSEHYITNRISNITY